MADGGQAPRIVIDLDHGGFDVADPAGSLRSFRSASAFAPWRALWLFHGVTAPLIRGFYYPISASERYGLSRGQGPRCVLLDARGDQLWLSGVACGGRGAPVEAARRLLDALSWTAPDLAGPDEMLFVDGDLVQSRPLSAPRPQVAPGKTFVRDGRLACRMEFDTPATTPDDLQEIWALSIGPSGWLGRPRALTLYADRARSQQAGHEGCQLIARGATGRELWLQLPEPDTYERLAFTPRAGYAGAFTQYEAFKVAVFRSVGVDLTATGRTWRDVLRGHHPEPAPIISWP